MKRFMAPPLPAASRPCQDALAALLYPGLYFQQLDLQQVLFVLVLFQADFFRVGILAQLIADPQQFLATDNLRRIHYLVGISKAFQQFAKLLFVVFPLLAKCGFPAGGVFDDGHFSQGCRHNAPSGTWIQAPVI